jgi:hypothetical protein
MKTQISIVAELQTLVKEILMPFMCQTIAKNK